MTLAVRVPIALARDLYNAAGLELSFDAKNKPASGGSRLAEHLRNVLRTSLGIPLDYDAGFEEGKAAGWADAQARLRNALKGA